MKRINEETTLLDGSRTVGVRHSAVAGFGYFYIRATDGEDPITVTGVALTATDALALSEQLLTLAHQLEVKGK